MGNRLGIARTSGALNGALAIGVTGLVLLGCANGTAPSIATCLDDSTACISQRTTTLNSMLADPGRAWIQQKPSPRVYATGVRLFAWRKSQSDLTCDELKSGVAETSSARKILAGNVPGASKTRLGQIIALSDDVKVELKRSARRKKCPKV